MPNQPRHAPDLCVFVGRFEPLHAGHLQVIRQGLAQASRMLVLVGSANEPRSTRNPFTAAERIAAIHEATGHDRHLLALPLEDSNYNLTEWINRVHQSAAQSWQSFRAQDPTLPETPVVALIGHAKDATSYYLNLFPSWGSIDVPQASPLSATHIRQAIFGSLDLVRDDLDRALGQALKQELAATTTQQQMVAAIRKAADHVPEGFLALYAQRARESAQAFLRDQACNRHPAVPPATLALLEKFVSGPAYARLLDEYAFVARYRWAWGFAPYAPSFVTADPVVIQSGHVLMVKRRGYPGKGLWALPGGFVESDETLQAACLRELKEETGLKVPSGVLAGSIHAREVFDAPFRSSRGRTFTHAFLIHLPPGPLPKVKKGGQPGDEETQGVKFIPLVDLRRDRCFEDHYAIIQNMAARI